MSSFRRRLMMQQGGGDVPLPSGYTRIKGVQGGGTAGILLTNFKPSTNCYFYYDGDLNGESRSTTGWNYGNVVLGVFSLANSAVQFTPSAHQTESYTYSYTPDKKGRVIFDYRDMVVKANILGVEQEEHTFTTTFTSLRTQYGLFVSGYNWNAYNKSILYRLIIGEGDVVYVDLHPCIEDSSGEVGLWDFASNSFKTCNGLVAIYA